MSNREAFAAAMTEERDIDQWQVRDIIWDLEGCTETVSEDRGVIAHTLWAHGVTPDHLGECIADEGHSIYENECEPCKELLLTMADRILSRVNLAHGSSMQEPEHMNLAPLTDDDLLRIANRPGGINDQLRAAMDARDHADGSTT